MALNELNETAALAGGDLDVGDFAEALEERAKLILSDVAGEAADEDRGVVGIGELVHGLRSAVESHRRSTHGRVHACRRTTGHHLAAGTSVGSLVLGGGSRDAHGAVAAVDALHFGQSALLIGLIGEADETVTTRHSADGVGHDLGGLAGWEAALEQRDENVFVDLGAKVSNEDGVLRATLLATVHRVSTYEELRGLWTDAYPRSASPPPVAQLSLKVREVFGIGEPLRVRAFAAAAGDAKSTKQ